MSARRNDALDRRAATADILRDRGDMLVVTGLGAPSWDVAAVGDHALNFYNWAGMGGAAMIGLGLAIAQPKRRVIVITGDGEMLMGLGSLATIAVQKPDNFALVVMDNEHYGETGMQETHTRHGVDLAGMAEAAGFALTSTVRTRGDLREWVPRIRTDDGPVFVAIKVSTDKTPLVLPRRDGTALKHRFREALLGSEEAYR